MFSRKSDIILKHLYSFLFEKMPGSGYLCTIRNMWYGVVKWGKYVERVWFVLQTSASHRADSKGCALWLLLFLCAGASFSKKKQMYSFLSAWKKRIKERVENVLSSEAVCLIFQITQWTRFAQTAFRISLLRLSSSIRDSISIQKILHTLKTSSCGMFSFLKKHGAQECKSDD